MESFKLVRLLYGRAYYNVQHHRIVWYSPLLKLILLVLLEIANQGQALHVAGDWP